MKKIVSIIAVIAVVMVQAPLYAQVTDAIELSRAVVETQRQAIVTANMNFTEEESQAFWPIYKEYRTEVDKVDDRLVKLIRDFAVNYETLTDEQADVLTKEYFNIETERLELRKQYIDKFGDVLTSKKLMRYLQIENKLDIIVKMDLNKEIPLVLSKDDLVEGVIDQGAEKAKSAMTGMLGAEEETEVDAASSMVE